MINLFPPISVAEKQRIATITAIAFHVVGFVAIGLFKSSFFLALTPLNLLVCLGLILWTQPQITRSFILFAVLAFAIGFGAEYIGVNTGILFGNYTYGKVMGPHFNGVPWLIGIQWLVIIYCIGVAMEMLHHRLQRNPRRPSHLFPSWWHGVSLVTDGATIAVIIDWVMEPVAIKLGYWQWQTGQIPLLNYFSWFGVSVVVLVLFHRFSFPKHNLFAIHLLLIQFMFFLLLRTVFTYG